MFSVRCHNHHRFISQSPLVVVSSDAANFVSKRFAGVVGISSASNCPHIPIPVSTSTSTMILSGGNKTSVLSPSSGLHPYMRSVLHPSSSLSSFPVSIYAGQRSFFSFGRSSESELRLRMDDDDDVAGGASGKDANNNKKETSEDKDTVPSSSSNPSDSQPIAVPPPTEHEKVLLKRVTFLTQQLEQRQSLILELLKYVDYKAHASDLQGVYNALGAHGGGGGTFRVVKNGQELADALNIAGACILLEPGARYALPYGPIVVKRTSISLFVSHPADTSSSNNNNSGSGEGGAAPHTEVGLRPAVIEGNIQLIESTLDASHVHFVSSNAKSPCIDATTRSCVILSKCILEGGRDGVYLGLESRAYLRRVHVMLCYRGCYEGIGCDVHMDGVSFANNMFPLVLLGMDRKARAVRISRRSSEALRKKKLLLQRLVVETFSDDATRQPMTRRTLPDNTSPESKSDSSVSFSSDRQGKTSSASSSPAAEGEATLNSSLESPEMYPRVIFWGSGSALQNTSCEGGGIACDEQVMLVRPLSKTAKAFLPRADIVTEHDPIADEYDGAFVAGMPITLTAETSFAGLSDPVY